MKFYYTFGLRPQFPYYRGWVVVIADNRDEADKKFRARFPDKNRDTLNCSEIYTEERFSKTIVAQGNHPEEFCHEVIE